jgi:hypothetical protein
MSNSRSVRISVEIKAEVAKGETRCEAVIGNLSDEGIHAIVYLENSIDVSQGAGIDVSQGAGINLIFETPTPTGETINLHCIVMWSERTEPEGNAYLLGLKIIEIPPEYADFYKGLYMKEMGMF